MFKKKTPYISYTWVVLMAILAVVFFLGNIWIMLFSDNPRDAGFINGLVEVFWCAVFSIPALLSIWSTKKTNEVGQSINKKVSEVLGGKLPRFSHFENNSVVVLNTDKNEVVLANPKGVVKAYPFSSLREWEIREETAGQQAAVMVTGTSGAAAAQGAMMGLAAARANSQARAQAAANTGLYLTVKDIDYPEWRVSMSAQSDRKRWFEILNQAINEGGVA